MRATPTSKELRKPEVITPSQPSVSSPEIENGFIAETQGRASAGPFQNASAFTIYLTLSLLYWGPALLPHFSQSYLALGTVADPTILMWCIAWWPHAIANGLNPFITHVVWPPTGYNLVWTTSIPGPSLLTSPITRLFGPVVSHNILCLLCPAAAAFFTFVLCRYISGRFWPALLGGYIFGFSPYVLSHIINHLCLLFIFPVPLAVYLVLLRIDRAITRRTFVCTLVCVLLFHFLSSIEIFATTTIFGAMALTLSYLASSEQVRSQFSSLIKEIVCAYASLTVLLLPFLYYVFYQGVPKQFSPSDAYSNDLIAFLVPTPVIFGRYLTSNSLARHFLQVTHWRGQAAYLGPGLWLTMFLFARSNWRAGTGRMLILFFGMFGIIALMSLGPVLHFDGYALMRTPWRIFNELPIINQALPGRFGMYLFFVVGVVASLYFANTKMAPWLTLLLAGSCLLFIAPRLSTIRSVALDTPDFFHSDTGNVRCAVGIE